MMKNHIKWYKYMLRRSINAVFERGDIINCYCIWKDRGRLKEII